MPENTVKLVYVRWCNLESNKPGALLQIVNTDGTLGREVVFERKAMKYAQIGGVYAVEQTDENAYRLAAKRYIGTYTDVDLVTRWQLDNKAEQVRIDADRMEKSAKELPEALQMLKPLRSIYRTALPDRKRAIEVILLDYLRRG